jgi:hypothetical protein
MAFWILDGGLCILYIGEIEDMHIPQHMKGYKFQVHWCELYRHSF